MLYPVVKRSLFEECGITLGENKYYMEDSTEHHLIEKIIMANVEWLSKDKRGVLSAYDPETHIQLGCRLVLNNQNTVHPDDIFWINLTGDEKSTMYEMIQFGLESVVNMSANSHMYTIQVQGKRGWAMASDLDGKPVALCANFVFGVDGVIRRG